jgi:hypothetical protein
MGLCIALHCAFGLHVFVFYDKGIVYGMLLLHGTTLLTMSHIVRFIHLPHLSYLSFLGTHMALHCRLSLSQVLTSILQTGNHSSCDANRVAHGTVYISAFLLLEPSRFMDTCQGLAFL